MPLRNLKHPAKPTVFLSHSSTNRRELLALKRLLDERAGGMIEFFLSSDDDSIGHGTIWPAEVRAALDRMSLMLIFVSSEALKSGWTYFEAGYGLHKLRTANIYCLPGTDKAALPSPFNILQNRNLHSAREVGLLIRQVNEILEGRMDESVSKEAFDRIFKRPSLGRVESGPPFEQLVESVSVRTMGPPKSIDIFSGVCRDNGFPVSAVESPAWSEGEERCSTGVRIWVHVPDQEELISEFPITNAIRKKGTARVIEYSDGWQPYDESSYMRDNATIRTVREIEAQNLKVRKKNEETKRENAKRRAAPRACTFTLSPINVGVPIMIIDHWIAAAKSRESISAEITLQSEVTVEHQIEAVSAKIYGSNISLHEKGRLLWAQSIVITLEKDRKLSLSTSGKPSNLSSFQIPELISALFELSILTLPTKRPSKRRR